MATHVHVVLDNNVPEVGYDGVVEYSCYKEHDHCAYPEETIRINMAHQLVDSPWRDICLVNPPSDDPQELTNATLGTFSILHLEVIFCNRKRRDW
jgi:hypothetical protein